MKKIKRWDIISKDDFWELAKRFLIQDSWNKTTLRKNLDWKIFYIFKQLKNWTFETIAENDNLNF